MKKILKWPILLLSFMLSFSIGFFMLLNTSLTNTDKTSANISGLSAEVVHLTGTQGYQPYHYFYDEKSNSTLVGANGNGTETYLNENGEECNSYYVIQGNSNLFSSEYSQGTATFVLTNEMKNLASKGILYVQASAGVIAKEDDQNDLINISLKINNVQSSVNSTLVQKSGVINPQWIKTEFIKVDSEANVVFEFKTLDKGGFVNYSKFSIYEPKLIFKVILNDFSFDTNEEIVYPSVSLKLEATNSILQEASSTEFMKYYKNIFKMEYKIIEGAEYASLSSGRLLVKKTAPNNAIIKVSAKTLRDSIEGKYLPEKIKTFKVNANKYEVKIKSNFSDPGTIIGNGSFFENQKITLKATPKADFEFCYFKVNGTIFNSNSVSYKVAKTNDIEVFFVRKTKVLSISGVEKDYDGSTSVDYIAVLEGKEENHEVYISGLTAKYVNADAGENKRLVLEGYPVLEGKDKDMYKLSTTQIPEGYGKVNKKAITLKANKISKIYGDKEEILTYTVEETDIALQGVLSREEGEDVGEYIIKIGDMEEKNPNFLISFISNSYVINPRKVTFNFQVEERVYDKTTDVFLKYSIRNTVYNDDLSLTYDAKFESNEAKREKVVFTKIELVGEKKSNYIFDEPEIYGNILKKNILITPLKESNNLKKIFGDDDNKIIYSIQGLIYGDVLTGELSRESGEDVGKYKILLGSLDNPNYNIEIEESYFEIQKRKVIITAEENSKIYGEEDPNLTYKIKNEVDTESLIGSLSRQAGEEVGEYQITIGNLYNSNYDIEFVDAVFKIEKRSAVVEIQIIDKEYDGNRKANYSYTITNLANNDEIEAEFDLSYDDKNVGKNKPVTLESSSYISETSKNYDFIVTGNIFGNITKKNVSLIVENLSKDYGDNDPEFTYNILEKLENDQINVNLERLEGESVGKYLIEYVSHDNQNYNIVYDQFAYLSVIPKSLKISAKPTSKIFGEEDPSFEYEVNEADLRFDDKNVVSGSLTRQTGNNPSVYRIEIGSLKTTNNYKIEFIEANFTILKRDVVVNVINTEKIYGDEDPVFTYETQNTVKGSELRLNLRREYGENIGFYTISYTSLNDPRYNISFNQGTLQIKKRSIKVKADNKIKEYGQEDPLFSVSVVEGELQFNDSTSEISQGNMVRTAGENVGVYKIQKGDFSLGENYEFEFEEGELSVIAADIEIKADTITKKYGNQDGELTYTISKGSLKFDDKISGVLEREAGENVGTYKISKGSLNLSSNYNIKFKESNLIIEKRPIKVVADAVTKIYKENDPKFTYRVEGGIVENDVLNGGLDRERPTNETNPNLSEMTGRYVITSTLSNPNYEITFVSNYLTIKQREIFIKAHNKSKIYGEEDPELTYEITSGQILDGEEVLGNVYRSEGSDVGKYDIRSNLTLGRNYKIVFTKGIFEIKPIEIKVKTYDYEKVYGERNPVFEYEIIEGNLINNDVLLGGVSKEEGEDAGVYRLISAFNNQNYHITLTENYLTIKKKDAYLSVSISDKVYNGDNMAYIRLPVVTGLIDNDVTVAYNKEESARFVSCEVGYNIKVELYNITLTGEKAKNYNLILPDEVYGNITNNKLASKNETVLIETTTNIDLRPELELKFSNENIDTSAYTNASKQVVTAYNIWLEDEQITTSLKDSVTVKIELPLIFRGRKNYYVYGTNKEGEKVLLSSKQEGKYLEVKTDSLGEFIVLTDNENWIDICLYVSIGLIGGLGIYLIVYLIRRKKKNKITA